MSTVTTTIDNVDPLIGYNPADQWSEGARDTSGDSLFARYSNGGTFTLTTTNGAYAEFTFNGTAVTIFGAKRFNHGLYTITLDNSNVGTFNGTNAEGVWGPLYSVGNLPQQSHTVRITHAGNTGTQYLDVDYITFNSTVHANWSTVDDTDSSFEFPSTGQWSTNVANASQYNASTGHITCLQGGSASYIFQGDSVQLFGTVGPKMGQYSVSLDGAPPIDYNAQKEYFASNMMLYAGSSLGAGQHNLTITNLQGQTGSCLALDYALANPAKPSASQSSGGNRHSSLGAVIGGVVAAIVVIIAIAIALYWFLWRSRRSSRSGPTPGQADFAAKDPFYDDVRTHNVSSANLGSIVVPRVGTGYPPTIHSQNQRYEALHGQNQSYDAYPGQNQGYNSYHSQGQGGWQHGDQHQPSVRPGTMYTMSEPGTMPDPRDYQHHTTSPSVPSTAGFGMPSPAHTSTDVHCAQSTYTSSSGTRDTRDTKARYIANDEHSHVRSPSSNAFSPDLEGPAHGGLSFDDVPPDYHEATHR